MKTAEILGRTIAQIQAIQGVTGANLQRAIIPTLEKALADARHAAEDLQTKYDAQNTRINALQIERDQLRSQVSELTKDKEMLDWLEHENKLDNVVLEAWDGSEWDEMATTSQSIRQAITAAMKGKTK